MFRYSEWSAEKKFNDLTIGVESYFSINGGQTALAYFSTGQDTDLGGMVIKPVTGSSRTIPMESWAQR